MVQKLNGIILNLRGELNSLFKLVETRDDLVQSNFISVPVMDISFLNRSLDWSGKLNNPLQWNAERFGQGSMGKFSPHGQTMVPRKYRTIKH